MTRALVASQDDPECPRWRKAFHEMPARTLVIQTAQGLRTQLPARVAAMDETRWAGFQCASVGKIRTTVILFEFGREVLGAFHMQNVPAALGIAPGDSVQLERTK